MDHEHPSTWTNNVARDAEQVQREVLDVMRRVLGKEHPDTLACASNLEHVRSAMRAAQPTRAGGKAAARRTERAAAPALSPTALAEAEARARAAEAELLALLDLEEPEVGGGRIFEQGQGQGQGQGEGHWQGNGQERQVGADSRCLRCCADSSKGFDDSSDLLGIARPSEPPDSRPAARCAQAVVGTSKYFNSQDY